MSLALKINLIVHIVVGLIAVAAFYAVLVNLLKSRLNFSSLRFFLWPASSVFFCRGLPAAIITRFTTAKR